MGAALWVYVEPKLKQAQLAKPAPPTLVLPAPTTTVKPVKQVPVAAKVPSKKRAPAKAPAPTATTRPRPRAPAPLVRPIVPIQLYIRAPSMQLVNTPIYPGKSAPQWDAHVGKSVDSFPVPDNPYTVTWWSGDVNSSTPAPMPGSDGLAVLLGHHEIGGPGVFNDIETLKIGQQVVVEGPGLVVKQYYVVERVVNGIPKTDQNALKQTLDWGRAHHFRLALVTCSGPVQSNLDSHENNTAVFLNLVAVK